MGLACVYSLARPLLTAMTLSLRPNLSLEDMRFYHQFLTAAYPSLPLRRGDLWIQVAALSYEVGYKIKLHRQESAFFFLCNQAKFAYLYQNEYLAHAILGLGASHLSQNGTINYTVQDLQHRVFEINLLNNQLRYEVTTATEADVLFAAVACLISQSALLEDGMAEYQTLVRGINIIMATVMPRFPTSRFHVFTISNHIKAMKLMVSEEPKDTCIIEQFMRSVKVLKPLCSRHSELVYLEALINCAQAANESSFQGRLFMT